jgi:hypothetical protein
VDSYSAESLVSNAQTVVAGPVILTQFGETLTELKPNSSSSATEQRRCYHCAQSSRHILKIGMLKPKAFQSSECVAASPSDTASWVVRCGVVTSAIELCRPYVDSYSAEWLVSNALTLVAGSMILTQVGETLTELKLGNGTSILIFASIASQLPSSVGAAFTQSSSSFNIAVYFLAFAVTTLGIVVVQVRRASNLQPDCRTTAR